MTTAPILLWLRNDLRLDDHAPLAAAIGRGGGAPLVPVYCLDPRHFEETALGHCRFPARRLRLLLDCLSELRARLRALGSELFFRLGRPEDILPKMAQDLGASAIYYHYESELRAVRVEQRLTERLKNNGVRTHGFWGSTLHHVIDLPYSLNQLPSTFQRFRRDVERRSLVRDPIDAPVAIPSPPPGLWWGGLPSLDDLWIDEVEEEPRGVFEHRGGEEAAQERLKDYLWQRRRLETLKETRHDLLDPDATTRLSPWLALGALSPRRIWTEIKAYEETYGESDSTYWLTLELRLRDYFRFLGLQHGARMYAADGLGRVHRPAREDRESFERWCHGETGEPFVDACMRELNSTGLLSARCRAIVAGYLVHTLEIDWRWGASYFATHLLDHDPCLNWLHWQQLAGVGLERRPFHGDAAAQGRKLDPSGVYIKRWIPALSRVPSRQLHALHTVPPSQLARLFGVQLGQNYASPILAPPPIYQAILPL